MTNLAVCDRAQSLNHRQLRLDIGRVVQEAHNDLHHLRDGLSELSMLLRELYNLLVQKGPVAGILAYRDYGDQKLRCRGQI